MGEPASELGQSHKAAFSQLGHICEFKIFELKNLLSDTHGYVVRIPAWCVQYNSGGDASYLPCELFSPSLSLLRFGLGGRITGQEATGAARALSATFSLVRTRTRTRLL